MMPRATSDAYKGETEQRSISMLPNFGGSTRRSSVSIDHIEDEVRGSFFVGCCSYIANNLIDQCRDVHGASGRSGYA